MQCSRNLTRRILHRRIAIETPDAVRTHSCQLSVEFCCMFRMFVHKQLSVEFFCLFGSVLIKTFFQPDRKEQGKRCCVSNHQYTKEKRLSKSNKRAVTPQAALGPKKKNRRKQKIVTFSERQGKR